MSRVFKSFFSVLSALAFAFVSTAALAGQWQIVESSGTVRTVTPVAGATLVSTGSTFNAGDILSTGFDGRVMLARDDQQIVVGPNSRMSLPAAEEPGMTRILQDIGTLLFKVDKRQEKHFRVETPVIAAVVKGTTFTVTAGAEAHAVHVAEGAVEVSTRNGMATELVTAGRTVRIDRSNPAAIRFSDQTGRGGEVAPNEVTDVDTSDREAALDRQTGAASGGNSLVVPTTIGAEPLDFATLSDGLVQSPEARGPAYGLNRANGVSGSAATPADAAANARLSAMNNGNAARAVGAIENGANGRNANGNNGQGGEPVKAPGNENGNAGNTNGNGNAGNGNENGNAGNTNGNGNAGNGNENGNAGNSNGNGNAGNGNENGNAGNTNGNGNAGNGNENGNAGNTNGNGNAGNGNENSNGGSGGRNTKEK